jgi:hypothetical protein
MPLATSMVCLLKSEPLASVLPLLLKPPFLPPGPVILTRHVCVHVCVWCVCVSDTFTSPWDRGVQRKSDEYRLPQCYYISPPALKTAFFQKFTDMTLFYIFYHFLTRPTDQPHQQLRESLVKFAFQELVTRGWQHQSGTDAHIRCSFLLYPRASILLALSFLLYPRASLFLSYLILSFVVSRPTLPCLD